jgi:hypothetical protein
MGTTWTVPGEIRELNDYAADVGMYLGLYQIAHAGLWTCHTVLADLVEANFCGYARMPVRWAPPALQDGVTCRVILLGVPVVWQWHTTPGCSICNNIYGYFYVDNPTVGLGNVLGGEELWPAPSPIVMCSACDLLTLTPRKDETPEFPTG